MNYYVDLDMEKTDEDLREEMSGWTAEEVLFLYRVFVTSRALGVENVTRQMALLREEILRRCGEEPEVGAEEET